MNEVLIEAVDMLLAVASESPGFSSDGECPCESCQGRYAIREWLEAHPELTTPAE